MPAAPAKALWYAVHLSNRASRAHGTGWYWSPPYDDGAAAKAECRRRLDGGDATMAFVVRLSGGRREIRGIYPERVRDVIDHYRDLLARLED